MNAPGRVWLRPGREKKIRSFYPWVQREEVMMTDEGLEPGGLVRLVDHRGQFLGIGTYNPKSRFPVRVLTLEHEEIAQAFFLRRLEDALRLRKQSVQDTNAYRLAFGEADGLPGLIVDRYGDYLVVQVRTLGMERLKPLWLPSLIELLEPKGIYERSDAEFRHEEGLEEQVGTLHGEVPDLITIEESGLQWLVPIKSGLKTGFYLDQRNNRRQLELETQPGERTLDLFCYTGGFSLYAARAGAQVVGVDILPDAIDIARRNAEMNGLNVEFECGNAFDWLQLAEESGYRFDRLVIDPPPIAKARANRDSLKWAIWKLVYFGLSVLAEGGRLLVCNCSYQFSLQDMLEVVRLAANDRGRKLYLYDQSIQAPDHPFLLQFPESLYLKCLWLRAD